MAWLQHEGARLWFETAGDRGTPVLLIMGFAVPGRVWEPQVEALSRHHRVVWYDNRGSGATRARAGLYSMTQLARDARALMDHLGWRDAHVVGASMGGMIAQELALGARERVRTLALVATHAGGGLRTLVPSRRGLGALARASVGPLEQRVAGWRRLMFPEAYLAECDREAVDAGLARDFGPMPKASLRLSQIAAMVGHDTRRRLARLEGLPTLVVQPDQDLLIAPERCAALTALIPGARGVVVRGAGHAVTGQCADQVNAMLLEHFRAVDATPVRAVSAA